MKKPSVRRDCPWCGLKFTLVEMARTHHCLLKSGKKCEPTKLCQEILSSDRSFISWDKCKELKLIFL